jgi:nitroreductase
MQVREALFGRRAVREYSDGLVDEAAIHAPNAVNAQPWAFTVVRDASALERISRESKAYMLATMPEAHADRFRPRLNDPAFDIFYDAPTLVVISARAQGPWIIEDCAMAAENLMLAAYSEGLGTCWIGFAQGYLNTPEGKAAIDAPREWVQIPIIVGKPKTTPRPVWRAAPQIHWDG